MVANFCGLAGTDLVAVPGLYGAFAFREILRSLIFLLIVC